MIIQLKRVFLQKCELCPSTDQLSNEIDDILQHNSIDSIKYKKWTSTDRSNLETIIDQEDAFIEKFIDSLSLLKYHDYVAKQQSLY